MRTDKNFAIKMRLEGKSYTQIQSALSGIPKSTLSSWLKDIVLSESAQQRLIKRTREKSLKGLLKRNRYQTYLAYKRKEETKKAARLEIKELSPNNLFHIGIALYWAEGYKRPKIKDGRELVGHPVSLTNADPALVKMFLRFIREICIVPEEKIRADLRIFEHINEQAALSYWSKETGISLDRFAKVHIFVSLSSKNKRPYNRLPFGVIQIRIYDTQLFHKIMGWIEGLKNHLPR